MSAHACTMPTCRANCGEPLDAVLVEPDGDGLHPTCVQAATPMLPVLREVLTRHQQGQDRSQQRALGPSQIGEPCDRALAYRLTRVPQRNDVALKWAPLMGTWGHAGIAEAYRQENARLGRQRYLIEQRVELPSDVVPSGTCDLYDQDTREALDWKFVGKTRMQHYRRHGPGDVYRIQAHAYGLGWARLGFDVRSVRIVFLPRWSHLLSDAHEWAEPYDEALAKLALERVEAIDLLTKALNVAAHGDRYDLITAVPGVMRERDGWPIGENCQYCPWHRQWPEGDGPADATGCPGK